MYGHPPIMPAPTSPAALSGPSPTPPPSVPTPTTLPPSARPGFGREQPEPRPFSTPGPCPPAHPGRHPAASPQTLPPPPTPIPAAPPTPPPTPCAQPSSPVPAPDFNVHIIPPPLPRPHPQTPKHSLPHQPLRRVSPHVIRVTAPQMIPKLLLTNPDQLGSRRIQVDVSTDPLQVHLFLRFHRNGPVPARFLDTNRVSQLFEYADGTRITINLQNDTFSIDPALLSKQ